jgi:hypothetical protein
VLLAYGNALAVNVGWAALPWFDSQQVRTEGLSISLESQPQTTAIMQWVRRNTPARAVVVEKVNYCERSLAGAIGYRQSFFVPCYLFTEGYPEAMARAAVVERLFSPGVPKREAVEQARWMIAGPAFLVLTREQNGPAYDPLLAELTATPGLRQAHVEEGVAVFAVLK